MSTAIQMSCHARGITRLCHFTPSRNLVHIATDPRGILSAARLSDGEKSVFNPTDRARFDGFPDHVCCSIQYPNAWYFRKARESEQLFHDWVVLLIGPHHLWSAGTKFCPRNASANRGSGVQEGEDAFEAMFAQSVVGTRRFERSSQHPGWLPTDEQAEVLIFDHVAREDILGVVVMDEGQAKREFARLNQLGVEVPALAIAPSFFEPYGLSAQLRRGREPPETLFRPGGSR